MVSKVTDSPLDIIIVGAGLAGLACAYALRDKRTLLLEKNSYAGGRVLTYNFQDFSFDIGACFAIDAGQLPIEFSGSLGPLIRERGPIGISESGRIEYADTPYHCLASMGLDDQTWSQIADFANGRFNADALMGTRAYQLLNALHHQIHPGDIADYAPEYQRQGFHNWFPDHWQSGNGAVIESFVKQCSAELLLNVEATSVEELADGVKVHFTQAGERKSAVARAVVLATTLSDTANLTQHIKEAKYPELFSRVRYGNFTVVALTGAALHKLPPFRYIVIADRTLSMLVQQRSMDRHHTALLCYYVDSANETVANKTDNELFAFTQQELVAVGLDSDIIKQIDSAKVHRWIPGGTVLSTEYVQTRNQITNPITKRIFIAGDYLSSMGYGTIGAIASGTDTAKLVSTMLN